MGEQTGVWQDEDFIILKVAIKEELKSNLEQEIHIYPETQAALKDPGQDPFPSRKTDVHWRRSLELR